MALYTSREAVYVEGEGGSLAALTNEQLAEDVIAAAGGIEAITGPGVPVGGSTGQVLAKASGSDFDTTWSTPATTFATVHGIGVLGAVETGTLPGMFVAVAPGQTVKLAAASHRIRSGTNVSWRLQRNGSDVAGFGTAGSPIVSDTTADTVDPADVTLADGDELTVVISAVSGSPADLSITIVLGHEV
jgi:hypothetical protein